MAELLDLRFQFGDRLLEIEEVDGHSLYTLTDRRRGYAPGPVARKPPPPGTS